MPDYTVITLFKDTPAERAFARRSLPAAARLGPSEIVLGTDAPTPPEREDYLRSILAASGFERCRIVAVPRSSDWHFHPLNVLWQCIAASKNDRILVADIDSALRREALAGAALVGRGRCAIVGLTKNRLGRTPAQAWRNWTIRRAELRTPAPFSGTFWLYRPLILQALTTEECRQVRNGFDTIMLRAAQRDPLCEVVGLSAMGSNSMDIENEDQPWRQFMLGVFMYAQIGACRHDRLARRPPCGTLRRAFQVRSNLLQSRMWPLAFIKEPLRTAVMRAYPWVIRGWVWAHRNPGHVAVTSACGLDYHTWSMSQTHHRQIRDWTTTGRTGTGF